MKISTHTLTWSVTNEDVLKEYFDTISTHTLTWSVTQRLQALHITWLYFNSHAHVERDEKGSELFSELTISTHTLTWSVTPRTGTVSTSFTISTHTLTWSVTSAHCYSVIVFKISTHTLTWSVTTENTLFGFARIFQLTRSRGA